MLDGGTTEPQAVKAYSILRVILNTAVKEDELIRQNPCRIPGYDRYRIPERPVATVAQVLALAGRMPPRFSALVIVAAVSGLRWGELAERGQGEAGGAQAAKGTKPKRPAREAASDGTAGATGTPTARKTKEG